jgi:nicotinamide-nucleotide amidase
MKSNHSDQALAILASDLAAQLAAHGRTLAVAESCTGGWLAKVLTDLAGSSAWFDRGLVTYSNQAKLDGLGVNPRTLEVHGAVSESVAAEMALGVRKVSRVDFGISTTGIAGPGGGSLDKPVGLVCFGWALGDNVVETESVQFAGDRETIRRSSVAFAISGLINRINRPLSF